jgi:hypothetical protein
VEEIINDYVDTEWLECGCEIYCTCKSGYLLAVNDEEPIVCPDCGRKWQLITKLTCDDKEIGMRFI